ncbi:ATP-binding protein [Altererythrobacter sp. MTPC7]|uniref:ATP-binding protein n=1 Tax=Altererythrobacter sp. MTPC7 TaxID=3056567 RepID=UPI0036F1D89E
MTAEVAILNRSAVALAADSVVTLTGPRGAKTFDTAEKIFELLRNQPVGLMIYNNPLFMDVPFEIIARQFRAENAKVKITGLMQVWPEFRGHLIKMTKKSADEEQTHLRSLVATEVRELQTERLAWLLDEGGRKRRRGTAKLDEHLRKCAVERRDEGLSKPLKGFLNNKSFDDFHREYGNVVRATTAETMDGYDIGAPLGEAIQEMIFALIKSEERTSAFTGLVFAGFGEADLFGSLQNIELDGIDFDRLATKAQTQNAELKSLNERVDEAVALHGDARRTFDDLETAAEPAAGAAAEAEQSRAEMVDLAEQYILKRAQAVTLRWAIERYRDENQDPLLVRASELFSKLTVGRYSSLQIDTDGKDPRLLGLRDDGRTVVDVGGMSEGTTDQLFLALRLAAVERSVRSGTILPFLADDLFVNFDEQRSEAGLRVLAELARSTQVLFFTHHRHLADIALKVVGADKHSLCSLD